MKIFAVYIVLINLIGFAMMMIDKNRAIKHRWRIPEKVFFIISALGGSLGSWMGMYTFRHKTRHWYFVIGIPSILIVQLAIGYFIVTKVFM